MVLLYRARTQPQGTEEAEQAQQRLLAQSDRFFQQAVLHLQTPIPLEGKIVACLDMQSHQVRPFRQIFCSSGANATRISSISRERLHLTPSSCYPNFLLRKHLGLALYLTSATSRTNRISPFGASPIPMSSVLSASVAEQQSSTSWASLVSLVSQCLRSPKRRQQMKPLTLTLDFQWGSSCVLPRRQICRAKHPTSPAALFKKKPR